MSLLVSLGQGETKPSISGCLKEHGALGFRGMIQHEMTALSGDRPPREFLGVFIYAHYEILIRYGPTSVFCDAGSIYPQISV